MWVILAKWTTHKLQHCSFYIGQPTNGAWLLGNKQGPWSEARMHSLYTYVNKSQLPNMRVST